MSLKTFNCRIAQGFLSVLLKSLKDSKQETLIGKDVFQKLPEILAKRNLKKPMIVTGPRVCKSDFFISFEKELKNHFDNFFIFSEVRPDPTVTQVTTMKTLFIENGCDSCIAIGGGSNIDAAKAMLALVVRPNKSCKQIGGVMKVGKKLPFLVAVPTTAGTGSECTVAAVITDDQVNRKYAINDPVLCPAMAVMDPVLTVSLPKNLTAYTGMDALTHAVEAYLNSPYYKKNTRAQAEFAIKNIFANVVDAWRDGANLEARQKMLEASYQAGLAFTTSCVGNVHAIAHTFGGLYHIQHGLANAVVLPYVLEEYLCKAEKQIAAMADVAGISGDNQSEKARHFIARIKKLNETMEIPTGFSEIKEEDIPKMASWADKEANPLYPVPVIFDKKHFESVIRKIKR